MARQHAKDISEYTKQIHAKDREIADLRKKTTKVWRVKGGGGREGGGEERVGCFEGLEHKNR